MLPPDSPARKSFEAQLQGADPQQRQFWRDMMNETDRLRGQIADVQMPASLAAKLRQIPESSPPSAWWELIAARQFGWKTMITAAAITVAVASYFFWPVEPSRPTVLNDDLALAISKDAVDNHEAQLPLAVSSADAAVVQAQLQSRAGAFPVAVLQPRAKLNLEGGGICDFHGTPAVFTRWQGDGVEYTVYQFDGKKLGVPSQFVRTLEVNKSLWHDAHHDSVVLWPGSEGKCTWALVLETESAKDDFSSGYY